MRRSIMPLLTLALFAGLWHTATACDGCCMSRVEYYVPAYRTWMWTASLACLGQCLLTGYYYGRHFRTWIIMALCVSVSVVLGKLFWVEHWPAWLALYPVLVQIGALGLVSKIPFHRNPVLGIACGVVLVILSPSFLTQLPTLWCWLLGYPLLVWVLSRAKPASRPWPWSFLAPTWALGAVMVLIMTVSEAAAERRQAQIPLADRMLAHGFRAATNDELSRLWNQGAEGLATLREILKKGNVHFIDEEGNRLPPHHPEHYRYIGSGERMLMQAAANELLACGDPETDVPLILEAQRRVEACYREAGTKGDGLLFPTVGRYFREKFGVEMNPDSTLEDYQRACDKIRGQFNAPGIDRARVLRQGGYVIDFYLSEGKGRLLHLPPYDLTGLDREGKPLEDLIGFDVDEPDSKGRFTIAKVPGRVKGIRLKPEGYAPFETRTLKPDRNGEIHLGEIVLRGNR